MAGEKTEKATPKKREDARKKGQVARSMDLNGAVILLAGMMAISAFAPAMMAAFEETFRRTYALIASPSVVSEQGIAKIFGDLTISMLLAGAPVIAVCTVVALLIGFLQVGLKPSAQALKPMWNRLNPINGAKNPFGPQHVIAETLKGISKISAVAVVAYLIVRPELDDMAALVGMSPRQFLSEVAHAILRLIQYTSFAYLLIAFADYGYQHWRHEKQLRMDKQEVKEEGKHQELPREVKAAQRRRAIEMSRRRMMDAVPTADVVVTNPTHYSVALRYDSEHLAPVVVAKGMDALALRIREVAAESGVTVVPDPPLARSLHASVEVGQMIPEELYQAVAQLLAHVYRLAARKTLVPA